MDTFYYARIAYARSIAENAGLTLTEEEDRDTPRTNRGSIYVPKYRPQWEEDSKEAINWWGKFLHEIYHNDTRYDNNKIFDILEKNKDTITKMQAMVNNMIEDHRIEYIEYGEYPGRDRIMDSLRSEMFRDYADRITKKGSGSTKVDALFWLQWECFSEWMPTLPYKDTYVTFNKETQGYCDILRKYIPRIRASNSAEESWELAKEICEELKDDSPKANAKARAKEGKAGEGEDDKVDYNMCNMDDHMHKVDPEDSKPDDSRSKSFSRRSGAHTPPPMEEKNPEDLPVSYEAYGKQITPHVVVDSLASQIKRYLLVKVRNKTINNQKSGRIDSASLWKAVVYNTSSTGKKVFQRDDEHLSLDTAVALLIDTSGSMHGDKYISASASAVILNEVFSKIGVKTRITGFTDEFSYSINFLHKDYGERITKERLIHNLGRAGDWRMSGNADGENILWEYAKLAQRPEPKKIMIVLSDGYPSATSSGGDMWQFTYDAVKKIEKEGIVDIIGIGIMDDSVKNFYSKCEVLHKVGDIEGTLLNILKRNVLHA